jgi:cytochrome c oxidase subunit 4
MYLRSLPRAAKAVTGASSQKLASSARYYQTTAARLSPTFSAVQHAPMTSQSQSRGAHAISNPTLAGIEKRWEGMPPQEQAELWMQLRDRMKVDWHEMTLQEKKAGMCSIRHGDATRAVLPKSASSSPTPALTMRLRKERVLTASSVVDCVRSARSSC